VYTTAVISGAVPKDSAYSRREPCALVDAEGLTPNPRPYTLHPEPWTPNPKP